MTNEECAKVLAEIENEYRQQINLVEYTRADKRRKALNEWANDNARFKVGDIITYPNSQNIMRIDKVSADQNIYRKNLGGGLFAIYYGTLLTKTLKPRKIDPYFSMYDDGREIIKIK